MKRFGLARSIITSALVAAAFAPVAQAAGAYSNVYFFGDSLTDSGAFFGLPGVPQGNRWTTRKADGSVSDLYADILARKYGYKLTPALAGELLAGKVTAGANDFAEGGGVMLSSSLDAADPLRNGKLVPYQIATYLGANAGKADPNALYMVWGGNNDLAAALTNPATAQAVAGQAAGVVVQQVAALKAAGAKHIIVGNAVDIGRTPTLFNTVSDGVATAFYAGVNNATTANTVAGAIAQQIGQGSNAALIGLMSGAIQTASGQASTLNSMKTAGTAAVRTALNAGGADTAAQTAAYVAAGTGAENAIAKSYATTATIAAVDALVAAGVINATQAAQLKAGVPLALTPTLAAGIKDKVYGTWAPASASASALASSVFNSILNGALGQVGDVVAIDMNKLMAEVLANPKAFGYDNVTGTACPAGANACVAGAAGFDGSKNFFFADGFHPTPQTHAIVAQLITQTLDAPYYSAQLINNQPLAVNAAQAALDERSGQARSVGTLDSFARVSRLNNDQDANVGALASDGSNTAATVGLDYQANGNTSLGVAYTYVKNKTDFSGNVGGFKADNHLLSVFGRYEIGAITVASDVFFGSTRFNDVHRNVQLGALNRVESADARGNQIGLRVAGSYLVSLGKFSVSPTVSLAYRENKVGGYSENCADVVGATSCSTSMRYEKQRVDSLLVGAGAKLDADLGMFKPFGSVMFYNDSKDKDRHVRAALVGQAATFDTEVYTPDSSYAVFNIGARAQVSKTLSTYLSYSKVTGAGDEKRDAVSVGLQAAF
ncbi:autotransporter domain-containing protein [Chitinimonas naiadis]